jgi:hypothetical protein
MSPSSDLLLLLLVLFLLNLHVPNPTVLLQFHRDHHPLLLKDLTNHSQPITDQSFSMTLRPSSSQLDVLLL